MATMHRLVGRSLSWTSGSPQTMPLHLHSFSKSPSPSPPASPRLALRTPSPFTESAPSFAFPSLDRLCVIVAASHQQAPEDNDVPDPSQLATASTFALPAGSLFLEPLLRTLVLGVSAGALAEMFHVLSTAASMAGNAGGLFMLPAILPVAGQALAPLFWFDHAVAIGVWAMLYLMEAQTLSNIISKHPLDPGSAALEARTTMTLPKRMLPLSMSAIRRHLFRLMSGKRLSTVDAASAAAAAANAFTPNDFARELERRHRSTTPSPGGGTTTIERPRVQDPTEPIDVKVKPVPAPPVTRTSPMGRPRSARLRPLQIPGPFTQERPAPPRPTLPSPAPEPAGPAETRREKELRERKAYLKNFWYAAGTSTSLMADKPMEVKVLGRTVTLFRDEDGVAKCFENLCAHRGASLGQGTMKMIDGHNCVVCPYHAWAFDGEGRLKDVPTSIQGQLPKRPMQETYPVEEKGGFIWLFFGSKSMPADERPPIPYIPELDDPKWRAVYGEMEFESPHWSTFDNALDFAHIHYVHSGSFGNPNKPEILDMAVERDTFGITGSFKIHNKPVNKLWEWTRVPYVPVEVKAFLPMTSAVRITLGGGVQMITFVNTVPIDEHRSMNRFCLIRNFATPSVVDGFVYSEMMKILAEDKVMVETVRPSEMPQEFSFEADLPQVAFRRLRQEWVDMGYAVDPSATTGPHGSLNM